MSTVSVQIEIVPVTCCNCGAVFGLESDYRKTRQKDHGWFYCPSGHRQHYAGENAEEKLRRQVTEAMARETKLAEELRQKERKLERLRRGVCPDCNRSFGNLKRHMNTKHAAAT